MFGLRARIFRRFFPFVKNLPYILAKISILGETKPEEFELW
jgi:hypothetical protein